MPASAHAIDSRCFWPPDKLHDQAGPFADESHQLHERRHVRTLVVEGAEQAHRFLDRQLVGELRFLELDAEALPQLAFVRGPAQAQHLDLARVGGEQALEDLDRGGLAGAVRAEQPEALAALDRERQPVDGDHRAVALHQIRAAHGRIGHSAIVCEPSPDASIRDRTL